MRLRGSSQRKHGGHVARHGHGPYLLQSVRLRELAHGTVALTLLQQRVHRRHLRERLGGARQVRRSRVRQRLEQSSSDRGPRSGGADVAFLGSHAVDGRTAMSGFFERAFFFGVCARRRTLRCADSHSIHPHTAKTDAQRRQAPNPDARKRLAFSLSCGGRDARVPAWPP